jgi:hypothetical protein
MRDDTLTTYSLPFESRDSMISIEVLGKLVVEPKTLGLGILALKKNSKMFSNTLE